VTNKQAICLDYEESHSPPRRVCAASYLGAVPYELALDLQQRLIQERAGGNIPDTLLLLEHPPVVTIGRFKGNEDLIVPEETLAKEGIAIFHTNRGGSVTYHGPGQLVGYPILNLKENRLGVREYVGKLEAVIINLLRDFGVQAQRAAGYPGVWVDQKKVCSIGIHITHQVTMHGFALNVNNDLRYFEYIRPCGMSSQTMTSLAQLLGHPVDMKIITRNLINSFSETFGLKYEPGDYQWLNIPDARNG